ncbi:transcriptional regulator FtrA [Arenicella chitinivorans]|uniref:Transcriptional regulator FtrA n=1 Tax=Arenicella chitinivorans TaxID=1329800 RepID=A0A918S178_9GAMM|nr:helix-turn-helix domain-containing protein [Arenicella chitinivorans]GHA17096.1 transcriptional regulator FtrA [Arenicella chitinivorans]
MKQVAILAYDGVAFFELACAVELFALPRPEFANWYQSRVVTFDHTDLTSTAGIGLRTEVVDSLANVDLLLIPSWPVRQNQIPQRVSEAVCNLHKQGKQILSFCSGAFLLGYLGLLNGRKATTHWRYADLFQELFPSVQYQHDVLYVMHQDIGCSAGSAAAIDLGLEQIRQDFGLEMANTVAQRLVMSPHRKGGQSQFVAAPMPKQYNPISPILDWATSHISSPFTVADMAAQASMSRRSFDRHFRQHVGCSPKQWLIGQRIDHARQLLQETGFDIERVAGHSGFESATALRHHFRQQLGVSPRQYRDQFGH